MKQKPRWWLLYGIVPSAAVLLWLDGYLDLSLPAHRTLEIAVVLLTFGLIALWVRANRPVLVNESPLVLECLPPSDAETASPTSFAPMSDLPYDEPQTIASQLPFAPVRYRNN